MRVGAHWIMMMKPKCRYGEIGILIEDQVGIVYRSNCRRRSRMFYTMPLSSGFLFYFRTSHLSQRQSSHWEHSISIGRYRSTQFIISLGACIKRPRLLFYLSQGRSLDPSIYLSSTSMYRVASAAHYPLRPCPCVVVPLAGCNPIVLR